MDLKTRLQQAVADLQTGAHDYALRCQCRNADAAFLVFQTFGISTQ